MTDALMSSVAATIEAYLCEQELQFERFDATNFAVALPGERRLKTACLMSIGEHALELEAFVMRRPDENHEGVYAALLQRNARTYGVHWAIDEAGDIYLVGRVSLAAISADEIDRLLGCVLEYADNSFNALLELGFGSSIRREWAWRVKRGESLRNLEAFADFVARTSE
jgi:hypothetical protein